MRAAAWLLLVVGGLAGAACGGGSTIDLAKELELDEAVTGWVDVGQVDGANKLVPSVTFKLKNRSDQTLKVLKVNAVFKQVGDGEEFGSGYQEVRGSAGLNPGEQTDPIHLRSANGYKAPQPRADMLANPAFVDAKVDLFAKYSSLQWTRIAEITVARQLVTN